MQFSMLPKSRRQRLSKGQPDHVDAWLMSYADLITLLFMVFVVFVSISSHKVSQTALVTHGEPEHPYLQHRSGTLELGTQYDEAYRALQGAVSTNDADEHIAVTKDERGVTIDLSIVAFFAPGSADIPPEGMAMLRIIAESLKSHMLKDSIIAVEGHTDDAPPDNSAFANDWELSAMRAARIAGVLEKEGIDAEKLRATGYSGAHPLVPNEDIAGHTIPRNKERNQRIIIRLENNPDVVARDIP